MIGAAALHKSAAGIAKLHAACRPLRRLCSFLLSFQLHLVSCRPVILRVDRLLAACYMMTTKCRSQQILGPILLVYCRALAR